MQKDLFILRVVAFEAILNKVLDALVLLDLTKRVLCERVYLLACSSERFLHQSSVCKVIAHRKVQFWSACTLMVCLCVQM